MKIPKLQTLRLTGPQSPEDAEKILQWLAPLIDQVQVLTQALQKRLSVAENLNIDLQTVPFRHNEELEVSTNVRVGIRGVVVIDSEVRTQPTPDVTIRRISNSRVGLTMTWSSDPVGYKEVSFLVIGA
jgi:hypothetical protein